MEGIFTYNRLSDVRFLSATFVLGHRDFNAAVISFLGNSVEM